MFDNEIRIPVDDIELLIQCSKFTHEKNIYQFYFNYTQDLKFLELYREAIKNYNKFYSILIKNYLDNIEFSSIIIDIPNQSVICEVNKND